MNVGYKNKEETSKQYIDGINDDDMAKIIREPSTMKKTNEVTNVQVLSWARTVEVQRARKA